MNWIAPHQRKHNAKCSLLCLPYAGGGASAFHGWTHAFDDSVEVLPIQLPGRESRLREPPIDDWHDLITGLAQSIFSELTGPWAVFGHSFGGLVAFELAQRAAWEGWPAPVAIYIGGCRPPDATDRARRGWRRLNDDDLVAAVRELGGAPLEVFEHSEMRSLLLPILRADFRLCELYRPTSLSLLDSPLVVYGGDRDPEVPTAELDGWRARTKRDFRRRIFPGGDHFFLKQYRPELLADLADDLSRRLL